MNVFQSLLFFFLFTLSNGAVDILRNPDFEVPPSNITENATSQFLLLRNDRNTIPGWSFDGTVWYVTPAANLSLPGGGHAIQLGENGRINQTFEGIGDVFREYILTFTLAAQNVACFQNSTAVNVSVLDHRGDYRSQVFSLGRNLSKTLSVNFGFYLGDPSGNEHVNLEMTSVEPKSDKNLTCWPIVDNLLVRSRGSPVWYNGDSLSNGDFEVGPAISKNPGGILLQDASSDRSSELLQEWKILGTVKYIDSKHFKVPQGKAAIELISGDSSGIASEFNFMEEKQIYTLNFTIGDANDSCVGDLLVFLRVGSDIRNFTVQSNGTGSASTDYSVRVASETWLKPSIMFYGQDELTLSSDGVACGAVLDNISLYYSSSISEKMELWRLGVIFSWVLGSMILL